MHVLSQCPSSIGFLCRCIRVTIHCNSILLFRIAYFVLMKCSNFWNHSTFVAQTAMFAGVEILNESNYISKEQNESEIQVRYWGVEGAWKRSQSGNFNQHLIVSFPFLFKMSLISHEEITTKSLSTTDSKNTKSKPKVGRKSDLGVDVKSCGNFPSPQPIAVFTEKEKWGKDIEFLLSCISLSVGLGNVWR